MKIYILLLLLLLLITTSCSSLSLPQRQLASRNGRVVDFGEYPQVVQTSARGSILGVGTGVLIAPSVVLTASHTNIFAPVSPSYISASVGTHTDIKKKLYLQSYGVVDRAVLSNDSRQELSLLKLEREVPQYSEILIHEDHLPLGTEVIGVGYGRTPESDSISFKREIRARVLRYAYVPQNIRKEAVNTPAPNTVEMLEIVSDDKNQMFCRGDSGGPVFFKDSENRLKLVGVLSTVHITEEMDDSKISTDQSYRCSNGNMARIVPIHLYLPLLEMAKEKLEPDVYTVLPETKIGFGASVPEEARAKIMDALQFALSLKGQKSTSLHRDIFGSKGMDFDGRSYLDFFTKRASYIGVNLSYKGQGLLYAHDGALFLTPLFLKKMSQLSSLQVLNMLVHEAHHITSAINDHVHCPVPFLGLNKLPVKSSYTGMPLAGTKACDDQARGSYALNYIMMKNIRWNCDSCSAIDKKTAQKEELYFLERIIKPEVKSELLNDQ